MSGRTRWWPVGVIALLFVTVLPQVAAVGNVGDSEGAAGPDLPRVSPVVGNNFRISGAAATASDYDPAVAYNPTNDQHLIVWRDERHYATRKTDIWGQLLAADGTRIGTNFRISGPAATADVYDPAVAYNPTNNQYLIVWVDARSEDTRGFDIYGRRVKATGNLAGEDFRICGPAATSPDYDPVVAYNATDNQYLVAWADGRDFATRGSDIYGRRVKATGSLAGGDFRISGPAATANEAAPAVVYNPTNNQYFFAWQDARNGATRARDIYGQRVKATGRLAGGDFRISGAGADEGEWAPAVAYNPTNNQYLVVWDDWRDYSTRGADIFGRRVKATGNLAGGDFRISGPAATSYEYDPVVAYNPTNGRYFVAWKDARNGATRGSDIYGQLIKATGKLAGGDFRISGPAATNREWDPAVDYNPTGNQYLVVWSDERNYSTRGWDIHGQRING